MDGVDDGLHADHAVLEDKRVDTVLDLAPASGRFPLQVEHVVGEHRLELPLSLRDVAEQLGEDLVYISVVGADRIPVVSRVDRAMFGYFASKLAAERVVADSGLPWTTLRATQFHDLTLVVARQLAKMPVIPVPAGVRFQPIDASEVATRLVDLSLGKPSGLVPDVAGPRVYGMDELLRSYLRASHRHRLIMRVRLPGKAYSAVRAGANLAPERAVGHRTWEDFLAERLRSGR